MLNLMMLSFLIFDRTPLHFAAENGHLSVVEYLFNQKANINSFYKLIVIYYIIRVHFFML